MKHLHQIIGIVYFFRMRRNEMSLSVFAPMTGLCGQILKLPWPMKARRTSSTLTLCPSLADKFSSTLQSSCYRALHQILQKSLHLMQLILFMGTISLDSTWARNFLFVAGIPNASSLIKIHPLQSHPVTLFLTSKCFHFNTPFPSNSRSLGAWS